MSLQVWLPLNGNLNNQGLSNITFTGTPSWKTFGKIGASALNLSSRITFNCPELNGTKYFSVCFWGMTESNPDSTANWMDLFALSDKTADGATAGTFRFETGYSAASLGGIHWHDNATNAIINGSYTYNTASEFGQWHHICITVSDTQVCSYYDGVLKQTHTSGLGGGFITGAGWIGETTTRGGIQDIRIYDHALSKKEVEEISKGLVLHYKLDGFTNITNPNLIKDSAPITQNWSSAGSNWANSLVECNLSPSGYAIRCSYSGTTQTSGGMHKGMYDINLIENGATYTLSGWIRASKNCKVSFWNEWMVGISQTNITTEWKYYKVTGVMDTSKTYKSDVCYMVASYVEQGVWIEAFGFKLEKSNDATPWIPHTTDALYAGYSQDLNVVYDSSGYGNNGTITGTITTSSNTPRYIKSSYFDGSSDIRSAKSSFGWFDFKEGTVAAWYNPANTTQTWASVGIQNDSGQGSRSFSVCNYSGKAATVVGYDSSWGNSSSNFSMAANTWCHLCATITNGDTVKLYANGELVQTRTVTNSTGTIASTTQFAVGVDLPGSDERFTGYLSDVRCYSTALTAEQVKELYNTSAAIDKNGNVYAREVIER